MEIRLLDLTLSVDDTHSDFWRLLQAGKWEATTLNVFDRYIDAETVFVDVGAWIGPTTLCLDKSKASDFCRSGSCSRFFSGKKCESKSRSILPD